MVINGKSGCSGGYWAKHLLKTETNERVEIKEMRGLYAEDLPEAFREMRLLAAATKARDYFYQANLNPTADEVLTDEQWEQATDLLEHKLHLDNHPRVIVEHAKIGEDGQLRTHRHIVWSRVDMDSNTVVPDDGNYYAHTETARELEQMFDLAPVVMPHAPERDRFKNWETFRAQESGITPVEMKAEITALWQQSDGGRAFQSAIEEKGYLLAKGDRRDFVLIDPEGDIHSLARRIDGAKAADIRAKMTDLDRDSLMGAKEASAWMKGKEEAENSGSSDARILPEEQQRQVTSETVQPFHNPKLAVLEKYALEHPAGLDPREAPFAQFFPDFIQPASTIYERGDQIEAMLRQRAATMTAEDWAQHTEDNERAWPAAFGAKEKAAQKAQQPTHEASSEHDPPQGEPPVELTSFAHAAPELATLPLADRERGKRQDETWLESVTRRQQEHDKVDGKDKTDEKEPELER